MIGLCPGECHCFGADLKSRTARSEPAIYDCSPDGFEDLPRGQLSRDVAATWLPAVAPGLGAAEVAHAAEAWASCATDLRRRTGNFVKKAEKGVPCRLIDPRTGWARPAKYVLDPYSAKLRVEEVGPNSNDAGRRLRRECCLGEVQNIWVCSDSELACRALGAEFHQGSADAELACAVLIDVPEGPIGLVERSAEAREEFLDCMAVLIALQRVRTKPELISCGLPGRPPPPEARLRPIGRSLRSSHLSGPMCTWLAKAGDGLLPPPRSRAPERLGF